MANYFFDSSALMKRYAAERGSAWVQGLSARRAGNDLILARITEVEVIAALVRHRPPLTPAERARAITAFQADCFQRRYRFVAVTSRLIAEGAELVVRRRLRGYDAVQLAAALEARDRNARRGFPAPILVSADLQLNAAAAAEGFAVDDPNSHP